MADATRPYHHGHLRAALLDAAVDAIAESGAVGISLRDLARRVGVTHGAAAHHFGDKAGLLTALAARGFEALADKLDEAWHQAGDFAAVGVAYVAFAADHPAHFEVMFTPALYRTGDPDVEAARGRAGAVLYRSAATVADAAGGDAARAAVAAWAYVHGIATLWREGNLPPPFGDDPVALTRDTAPLLFQRSAAARGRPGPDGRTPPR